MYGAKLIAILKDYSELTSICGFRYLTQNGRALIERLFWLLVIAGCCFATFRLTKLFYNVNENNPVSFVIETDYLHWNTSFPQIVVCETESEIKQSTSTQYVKKNFPEYEMDYNVIDLIHRITFEYDCSSCSYNCNERICNMNFMELIRQMILPCEKLMKDCIWNGEPFDCCSKFETVITEQGICYSANPSASQYKHPIMVVNKHTGPAAIEFKATRAIEVFLIRPEDTPYRNSRSNSKIRLASSTCSMIFTVKDMINDENLIHVDFERRKCKFPHETDSKRFDRYSQSACVADCRARYQLKFCNCTHHYMNSESTTCDAQGLTCLYKNNHVLGVFRLKGHAYRPGIECDCPSSCVEPEYNIVYKGCHREQRNKTAFIGAVRIQMASLPTMRFKRILIRSKLDLVVAVGGIASLFLGASLLSAAEIVMFFCVRPFSESSSGK